MVALRRLLCPRQLVQGADIAVPPRPYRFFDVAWKRLHPLGFLRLLLARQSVAGRSRLLAGSLFLMFGQTVFYSFTGWRREDMSLRLPDVSNKSAANGLLPNAL